MSKLDCLVNCAAEARTLITQEPCIDEVNLNAVRNVIDEIIKLIAVWQENLLVVLDDPTESMVETWLKEVEATPWLIDVGKTLESTLSGLCLKQAASLSATQRKSRSNWIGIAKGILAFLQNPVLFSRVAFPLRASIGAGTMAELSESYANMDGPLSPVASVSAAAAELRKTLDISMPLSPRTVPDGKSNYSYNPPRRRTATEFAQNNASNPSPLHGSSPNFLSGWRPDTPSTTTPEDAEYRPRTPSSKIVDGSLVQSRPGSGVRRLPPLDLGAVSAGG